LESKHFPREKSNINKDPFPGWVDTVSAAGALYLLGGIGLIQVAHGNKNVVGDQVPVDYVADAVIVAAAAYARTKDMKVCIKRKGIIKEIFRLFIVVQVDQTLCHGVLLVRQGRIIGEHILHRRKLLLVISD